MNTNTIGNKGVVAFYGQVINRVFSKLCTANNREQVPELIYQAIIRANRFNLYKRIELIEDPVIRGSV